MPAPDVRIDDPVSPRNSQRNSGPVAEGLEEQEVANKVRARDATVCSSVRSQVDSRLKRVPCEIAVASPCRTSSTAIIVALFLRRKLGSFSAALTAQACKHSIAWAFLPNLPELLCRDAARLFTSLWRASLLSQLSLWAQLSSSCAGVTTIPAMAQPQVRFLLVGHVSSC